MNQRTCSVAGCAKSHFGKGLCNTHYVRWRKHGDPLAGALKEYPDTCTVEGCDKKFLAKGYCALHYYRVQRTGDPEGGGRHYSNPEDAFSARTEWRGKCLVWTGTTNSDGYGVLWAGTKNVRAHRYAWERANGPIPEGLQIDHICWNRACVNVEHLRPATHVENMRNQSGRGRRSSTGYRGVYAKGEKFEVKVRYGGRQHYLGMFETVEEASAVASAKRAEVYGEFAGSD